MLFQKKRTGAGTPALLNTKHQDAPLMVSPIVAHNGHQSNSSSVSAENKVVLTGIDTLVITAGGNVAPSKWLVEHQSIWKEYQENHTNSPDDTDYITDEVNGSWFSIKHHGIGLYKYVLDNPEIGHIRVWNTEKWESACRTKQHIYADFRSSWLHQHKPQDVLAAITKLLSKFFEFTDPSELNIQISRIDLHTDITNGSSFLSQSQVNNTITRSKYRNYFMSDDTIKLTEQERELLEGDGQYNKSPQKLIPSYLVEKLMKMVDTQSSFGADNVVHKREIETCYFGKMSSDVWCKMYDKTKCCKNKSDLDTPLLWEHNGWNSNDTVIRVEFSMRRAFIKQLDNGSYVLLQDFISNMSNVWDWMTNKWLRMVDSVKQNNIQLSNVSSFWKVVQQSFTNATNNIIRKRNHQGKVHQLMNQAFGCLRQAVAKGMLDNEDIGFMKSVGTAVNQVLSSSYHSGEIYERRVVLGLA